MKSKKKQKKQKDLYPENILFYLDKIQKEGFENNYFTNWNSSKAFNVNELTSSKYGLSNKIKIESFEDKKKFQFPIVYFHQNFKDNAKKIAIKDEQKIKLLDLINKILFGNNDLFTNEQFHCKNKFLYSLFIYKEKSEKPKQENWRINFGVFFEKTKRIIPYSTYIEKIIFLEVSNDITINYVENYFDKVIYSFENEFMLNNCDLEYDKMILIKNQKGKLFNDPIYLDENNYHENCIYPFLYELPAKNDTMKKIKLFDKEYIQGFDLDDWDLKYPIDYVLEKINKENKLNYNNLFEKDILNFSLSRMENKLVNMNYNSILSGRPGTGKTIIILLKVVMYYLNCLYEHSKIINNNINYDFINQLIANINNFDDIKIISILNNNTENNTINNETNNKNNTNEKNNNEKNDNLNLENEKENKIKDNTIKELGSGGKTYKIIFTSLSQSLCSYVEDLFIQGLHNSKIPINFQSTSQKQYEKMSSFVNQKKYPLFLNFRKLLFMIDGSLNFQFFDRPNNNKLKMRQDNCDIKYFPDCQYDVMVDLSMMIKKPDNIFFYRRKYLDSPLVMTEINEDTFFKNFDNVIKNNKILNNENSVVNTYEVYSNILTIIKGSVKSYLTGYLSCDEYLKLGKKICIFNNDQRKEIYKIFQNYEKWKYDNKYFDIQDLVNYLIREVNIELVPKERKILDLVFIDEVQDFSINQLYLLFLISREIKVLAGDTCQTISKINTFRFADLKNALYTIEEIDGVKINEPKAVEVNMNFRCQASILKLSHLIYEMIKYFFSNTLDKVGLDFSVMVTGGVKPYIIPPKIIFDKKTDTEKNGFDYFLKGLSENNLFLDDNLSNVNINFSVNHCVICRNENVAKFLSKKYNNKIFCSTVYECKGLEFEIVIIYNFFKDSLDFINEIWKYILKNISFKKVENNYLPFIKENLNYENISETIKDQVLTVFKDKFNIEFNDVSNNKYSLFNFCSELKEFYVAVTRAKSRLFFYEEDMEILKLLMERIIDLDLVTQEIFVYNENKNNNQHKLYENLKSNEKNLNKKIIGLLKFLEAKKISKENLIKKAFNEYNQDKEYNYKIALYLFGVLNDTLMKNKCIINIKYIQMQKIKESNDENNKEYIKLNSEILELINSINYDDDNQIKGEVLMNLNLYEEALKYFLSKKNYKKCGLVLIKQKKYKEALEYFIKANEYSFAVDCFKSLKEYEKLYLFVKNNNEHFDLEHINNIYKNTSEVFFKKYKIPTKDIKNFINNNVVNNKLNYDEEKNNELEIEINSKNVFLNSFNNNTNLQNLFIENNNLANLMSNNKIEIKAPFILCKYSNNEIFNIDNSIDNPLFYSIKKTKEQIIYLIQTFRSLLNYIIVYLETIVNKIDNNKQKIFIERYNTLIENLDKKLENGYNQYSITELEEILDKLIVKEYDDRVIINSVLLNIKPDENSHKYFVELYDINVFKLNILEHIINSLPILYLHKKNYKINVKCIYNESIKQLVEYCSYLPLSEENMIKNLESVFILNNQFDGILGIIKNENIKKYIDISILLRKRKMFELLIKKCGINLLEGTCDIKYKNIINNLDILVYLNNYINILLGNFFKYISNNNNNDEKYKGKIEQVLNKIKIFPQIYYIILQIYNKNKNEDIDSNIANFYLVTNEIDTFYDYIIDLKTNTKENFSFQQTVKMVIIASLISILVKILGDKNIKLNITKNDTSNELIEKIIVLIYKISRIVDEIKKIKDTNGIINNIPIHSLLNGLNIYSINNIITSIKEFYKIKYSFNEKEYVINPDYYKYNECYLRKTDKNVLYKTDKYFDKKNNIIIIDNSFPIDTIIEYLSISIDKFQDFLAKTNNKNIKNHLFILSFELIRKTYYEKGNFDLLITNNYLIRNESLSEFNEIIKSFSLVPYEGEYFNENKFFYTVLLLIFQNNNYIYDSFVNKYNDISVNNNKKELIIKLVNYLLYSNLLGGFIKTSYINYNFEDEIEGKLIKKNYFSEKFSYIHALYLLNDYYCSSLNPLLVSLWLRKIYNCIFCNFDQNSNKIKLYSTNENMILNIFEIKKILDQNYNSNKNEFINIYFDILMSFIDDLLTNKNYDDIINNYLSEIFYSLQSLLNCDEIINDKINHKYKAKINSVLEKIKLIKLSDKQKLYEVKIVFDKNLCKKCDCLKYKKINIVKKENKDEFNEEYEGDEDGYDDYDDYDDIEDNLMNKIDDRNNAKYF